VLALFGEGNSLSLYIDPAWHAFVHESDREYIESLLKDFAERINMDPEALFQQLCSLNVGPLVAVDVGTDLAEFPALLKLWSRFVRL